MPGFKENSDGFIPSNINSNDPNAVDDEGYLINWNPWNEQQN